MDIILSAATGYARLFGKQYYFEIAHKKQMEAVNLTFEKSDFFHIVGLQYLKDIDFGKDSKQVFDHILNQTITDEALAKSSFYNNVEENYVNVETRIKYFQYIESFLDSNNLIFKFIGNKNPHSKIRAEYLIEVVCGMKTFEIFLLKRKDSDTYRIVSFFEKKVQYHCEKRYWLYKEKCNILTGEKIVLYTRKKNT